VLKRTMIGAAAVAVLAVAGCALWAVIYLDHFTWAASRRLARGLDGAQEVVLIEYADKVEITRKVAIAEEISRLRRSITTWPRPFFSGGSLCFLAHHTIELHSADRPTVEVRVCFLCEQLSFDDGTHTNGGITFAPLPPYMADPLAAFFTSVGMSPKPMKEYDEIEARAQAVAGDQPHQTSQ
jgi:hypothetical protein